MLPNFNNTQKKMQASAIAEYWYRKLPFNENVFALVTIKKYSALYNIELQLKKKRTPKTFYILSM